MQSKSFITTLMMLVKVSHAVPHSSYGNGATSSGISAQSLPDFSPGSPAYNNVKDLYNQINQIMFNYSSQSGSNSDMNYIQDRMNDIGSKLFEGYDQGEPATSDQPAQPYRPTQYAQPSSLPQSTAAIQTPPLGPPAQPTQALPPVQPAQPTQATSSPPQPSGSSSQFDANGFLQLINEFRSQNGAGPVKLVNALNEAAVQHNNYMISINTLTHDRAPGQDIATMIKQYGGTPGGALGECVAEGALTTQDVFNSWKNDGPHAAIMKNPDYTQMGVALNGSYSTAEFSS